jgi:hypothetical protein
MERHAGWQYPCGQHLTEIWKCPVCRWTALCCHEEPLGICSECRETVQTFEAIYRNRPKEIKDVNLCIHGVALVHLAVDDWCLKSLRYLISRGADLPLLPSSEENVLHILGRSGLLPQNLKPPIEIVKTLSSNRRIGDLIVGRDGWGTRAYDLFSPFPEVESLLRYIFVQEVASLRSSLGSFIWIKPLAELVLAFLLGSTKL